MRRHEGKGAPAGIWPCMMAETSISRSWFCSVVPPSWRRWNSSSRIVPSPLSLYQRAARINRAVGALRVQLDVDVLRRLRAEDAGQVVGVDAARHPFGSRAPRPARHGEPARPVEAVVGEEPLGMLAMRPHRLLGVGVA